MIQLALDYQKNIESRWLECIKPCLMLEREKELVIRLALNVIEDRFVQGESFTSSVKTKDYLKLKLAEREREVFVCMFLDSQHRLIKYEELFYGTIDSSMVHPREVVKEALRQNAAVVIFAHNHPSGISEPSQADISVTRRLKDALSLVDIRVLDHLIVGEDVFSMAERGLI